MLERDDALMAQLDLTNCPLGLVLNRADPDTSVEDTVFAQWDEPFREPVDHSPSYRAWVVIDDEHTGARVLQHEDKRQSGLLTGEDHWADYVIETELRQILANSQPNLDDEYSRIGRTALVVRQQTTRRFYSFGAEGYDDFVLYRRRDEEWVELGRAGRPVDRSRYHRLAMRVTGNRLQCLLDGETVIDVRDDSYRTGKLGIRTNTLSRCAGIRVGMTPEAQTAAADAAAREQRGTAKRAATWPQLTLVRDVDLGGANFAGLARHTASDDLTMLLREPGDTVILTMRTAGGETIWRRDFGAGKAQLGLTADLNRDGCSDIVGTLGSRLLLIDGATGQIRAETDIPPAGPHMGPRGALANAGHSKRGMIAAAARLQPNPAPPGLVFREDGSPGSNTIWGYDSELNHLWTTHVPNPKFGHNMATFDVDGDGRDELLLGSYLFGPDGEVRWRLEGCEYWDRYNGARHVDGGFIAQLSADPADGPTCVLACGAEGIIFADPTTGHIRYEHLLGHVQTVVHGHFRDDVPGRQVWSFNRHGNFGIMTLHDAHGTELLQVQPHYELFRGHPVKWAADRPDLLLMNATYIRGLYDGDFRLVAPLPAAEAPGASTAMIRNIDGDGLDEILFRTPHSLRIYSRE